MMMISSIAFHKSSTSEDLGGGWVFIMLLAMIFAGQENPSIIFRSKEIYIYFKTNNKIPINLLK